MKIRVEGRVVFLADGSPAAQKIAQGRDYRLDAEGALEVLDTSDGLTNAYQFARAIKKAASVEDLKKILLKLTELLDSLV